MGRLRGQAQIPEQRCMVTESRVADRLMSPQPDSVVPNLYPEVFERSSLRGVKGGQQRQRVFSRLFDCFGASG